MLKTTSTKSAKPKKGGVKVGVSSIARRNRSEIDSNEIDGSEVGNDKVGKKVQKTSKSKNLSNSKKTVRSLDFFIFGAKLVFTKLRQVFFKAPILHHFNPERHIRIEMDVSDYAINGVFS